jgi:hypothetical protein
MLFAGASAPQRAIEGVVSLRLVVMAFFSPVPT